MTAQAGTAIHAALAGNAGINALVGSRIYPRKIPQDADLPAIAYRQVSNVSDYTQSGKSGLRVSRYQLVCKAARYDTANELAGLVDGLFSGYSGMLGGLLRANVFVDNVLDLSEIDPEIQANAIQVDIMIHYQE